jgi:hypothetical protein
LIKSNLQPYGNIDDIDVQAGLELQERKLLISFTVQGKLDNYFFPETSKLQRVNELWKATCFELFLANSKEEAYYELNFSSSLAWNFYVLKEYRAEVKEVKEVKLLSEATIQVFREKERFKIELVLEGFDFENFDIFNLTCILLTKESKRNFWSSKKMNYKPDFHHRKYFLQIK